MTKAADVMPSAGLIYAPAQTLSAQFPTFAGLFARLFANKVPAQTLVEQTPRHTRRVKQERTPEYMIWVAMRQRCLNPRMPAWHRYGGRGITICPAWGRFGQFLADMGPRPSSAHSLDRIDNDGHYEPGNCRWATWSEQNANKGPLTQAQLAHLARLRAAHTHPRWKADATHCDYGHAWTPDNTRMKPGGGRWCRACLRMHMRARRNSKRPAKLQLEVLPLEAHV